jgi:hypothetical protein
MRSERWRGNRGSDDARGRNGNLGEVERTRTVHLVRGPLPLVLFPRRQVDGRPVAILVARVRSARHGKCRIRNADGNVVARVSDDDVHIRVRKSEVSRNQADDDDPTPPVATLA